MANPDHIAQFKKGVASWNVWRSQNANLRPNLSGANLFKADLRETDFSEAELTEANLSMADLYGAELSGAELTEANLSKADLREANLNRANLTDANLSGADLRSAKLRNAKLSGADLRSANLMDANLSGAYLAGAKLREANFNRANLMDARFYDADLRSANLSNTILTDATFLGANLDHAILSGARLDGANLSKADLSEARLNGANLYGATLLETDLTRADLTGCQIYGVSAWGVKLDNAKQQNLIIARRNEPEIMVDNIEVAQFVYLLLHNQKIRDVIDTITSKAVLILGRFTDERKAVLDAIREELRKRNYLPILFDFSVPASRDITETVSLLARMARFIIADLTDPSSIPKELEAIVPDLAVPVQPLLEGSSRPYAMFKDYWKYEWVLPVYRYEGLEPLLAALADKVIAPAEAKVKALEERRRMIEAELTKGSA
jgi:uncharacterized protein YjbI with pentapeptide repeats